MVRRRTDDGIGIVRSHRSNLTKVGRVAQEVNKLRKARRQSPPELGLLLMRERVHACAGNACFILPGLTVAPLALLSLIWAGRRHCCHLCTWTGNTSAPGLDSTPSHLLWDRAHPLPPHLLLSTAGGLAGKSRNARKERQLCVRSHTAGFTEPQ